jgi:PIN domain nuclease of toxin-antitoxin system
MKLLLDTHALHWFIEGDAKLSVAAKDAIADASNEILISPASFWEMAIKISLGKWQLNQSYAAFLDIALIQYRFIILPIKPTHTERLLSLSFHHRDPFDRLLVAQALVEQIAISSADTVLDAYGIQRIW